MGGLLIDIIFIDAPEKIFSIHIYSDVDETAKKVTGYEILGVKLNEYDSGLTKDKIFKLVKEHPENKLW